MIPNRQAEKALSSVVERKQPLKQIHKVTSLPLPDDQHSITVKRNCAVIKASSDIMKNTILITVQKSVTLNTIETQISLSSYQMQLVLKDCTFSAVTTILPQCFQCKSHRTESGKTDSIQHICKKMMAPLHRYSASQKFINFINILIILLLF